MGQARETRAGQPRQPRPFRRGFNRPHSSADPILRKKPGMVYCDPMRPSAIHATLLQETIGTCVCPGSTGYICEGVAVFEGIAQICVTPHTSTPLHPTVA